MKDKKPGSTVVPNCVQAPDWPGVHPEETEGEGGCAACLQLGPLGVALYFLEDVEIYPQGKEQLVLDSRVYPENCKNMYNYVKICNI